jgi:hypothetical protein
LTAKEFKQISIAEGQRNLSSCTNGSGDCDCSKLTSQETIHSKRQITRGIYRIAKLVEKPATTPALRFWNRARWRLPNTSATIWLAPRDMVAAIAPGSACQKSRGFCPDSVWRLAQTTMTSIYSVIAQTADELQDTDNSPSISIWPYLVTSAQTQLLSRISVYGGKGGTWEQTRLLYMNAVAVEIWKAMGKPIHTIDGVHRPPRSATLVFGVPLSE